MRSTAIQRTVRDDLAALAGLPRAALAYLGRAAERLTRDATSKTPAIPPGLLPTPYGGKIGEANDWNVAEALRGNVGHVYTAIKFNADQIEALAATMRLVARKGGESTDVDEHYILEALEKPNELYSGPEMLGLTAGCMQSAGFHVWVKIRDGQRRPLQFWPLMPDRMKFVAGKTRPIEGVNYYPDGIGSRPIGFDREDCIIFRTRALNGSLYGWPPLRAALLEKVISDKALRMRLAWFENQARPDYWIAPKLPTGKERPTALAKFWASLMLHHQGVDKYGLPLVIPEGTQVGAIGTFSAVDVQLIEQLTLTQDNIFEMFGTSRLLHGHTENSPARATLDTEWDRYGVATLEPMACSIWGSLNRDLIDELNQVQTKGVRLKLERDPATKGDKEFKLRAAVEGFESGLLKKNEGRSEIGYEPTDDETGEQYAPRSTAASIPLANAHVSAGTTIAASTAADVVKEIAPALKAELQVWLADQLAKQPVVTDAPATRSLPSHLATDEKRAEYWAKQIEPQDRATVRATHVMRAFFHAQADRVLPQVEREIERLQGKYAGWSTAKVLLDLRQKMGKDEPPFDGQAERDHTAAALRPIVRNAVDTAGKLEASQLGIAWDIESEAAQRWINTHLARVASDITDTTAEVISNAVRDGIAAGHSTGQIAQAIRDDFDTWATPAEEAEGVLPGYRAARIARTEIGASFGFGQQSVLEDANDEGLLTGVMWLTARDEHVRDSHQIDGETVAVDERFSNGLLYPGDMSTGDPADFVNCRCTQAAVVKGASMQPFERMLRALTRIGFFPVRDSRGRVHYVTRSRDVGWSKYDPATEDRKHAEARS